MSIQRKLQFLLAFTTLLTLALAVGCKGFFVNSPSSLVVSPNTVTLNQGQTQQLTATATFNDNSTKNETTSATWTTAAPCTVSVGSSSVNGTTPGLATAVGSGGAVTITATFNGVSNTATVTAPAGLTISPCGTFKVGSTGTVFVASLNGTPVTTGVTWTSADSAIVNFASSSSGAATFPKAGTTTITAAANPNQGQLQVTTQ